MKSVAIVRYSMRRPITIAVLAFSVVLAGLFSLRRMSRDILPNLGIPIIYVAQPYGGMDPAQMESYLTYYYEYHFLYITGIEHIESKNIQSTALIKLQFHPGTDMAQAMAETINYVNRAKAFMPPGTLPPFVMRFDAGSEPVGNLVFASQSKTVGELQNLALNYVRPLFATLPGVSAPPPFGSSQRTVVIRIDPKRLMAHNLSPYDVADAVGRANKIIPSGNIELGNQYPIVPLNSVVQNIKELEDVPLRLGTYPTVFLKDVGSVVDGTDIQTGYALVNGKRTVYIPVTKRPDASTLSVVNLVKKNLPRFQNVLPDDVRVSFEFDQSGYVTRAIDSLFLEGLLGALLTGLMVLLFLRDWRSALVVVLNIPLALLVSLVALWLTNQTINIMTLGGLALAIGILVDETTVTIENIHRHLSQRKALAEAALEGASEVRIPCLLNMLCILAVFIPSFFMVGVSKALFVPLTLAVGFSMIGSFFLSGTLVPVLCTWLLKEGHVLEQAAPSLFTRVQTGYGRFLSGAARFRFLFLGAYLIVALGIVALLGRQLGLEIFPRVESGQFQLRLRTPTGSSLDYTEARVLKALEIIKRESGESNVESSVGFVGSQPPNYPINTIYLWTSGSQEAVLQVALRKESGIKLDELKERLRARFRELIPETTVSFEVSGLVDRVLSQGATTPIEIALNGKDLAMNRKAAEGVREAVGKLNWARDLQFRQVFEYPAVAVTVNRRQAGILGLSIDQIGQALVPATSSSRYLLQNYWSDPKNGINYQVQVEVPQEKVTSVKDLENIPVSLNGGALPLRKFADVRSASRMGEYDRYNMQRMVTLTGNIEGIDLGHAARETARVLEPIRKMLPKGVEMHLRGQISTLTDLIGGQLNGLAFAILVIFLLLTANFESVSLSFIVLSTVPAVLSGVVIALLLTHTTLNIESFMGTIMSIGVAVANAILLVTFAERHRLSSGNAMQAAIEGAQGRLRPILMTSFAMIAGMVPLATGLGEGGQQIAPLGRAVIGGLLASTVTTLTILPLIFGMVQRRKPTHSASLDPSDSQSARFNGARVSVR